MSDSGTVAHEIREELLRDAAEEVRVALLLAAESDVLVGVALAGLAVLVEAAHASCAPKDGPG